MAAAEDEPCYYVRFRLEPEVYDRLRAKSKITGIPISSYAKFIVNTFLNQDQDILVSPVKTPAHRQRPRQAASL